MYTYRTKGTCSLQIQIEMNGNIIEHVHFVGGCNGNTQGIARLVAGMSKEEAIKRLKGINCNGRGTSCPDQLAIALETMPEA